MQRRLLASGVGLLALAACTAGGTGTTTSVGQVVMQVQYLVPLLEVLMAGVAAVVPAVAPVIAAADPYVASVYAGLNLLSVSMPVSTAQPIVKQIEGDAASALGVIRAAVVSAAASNAKFGPLLPKLDQASAVLKLLTAFADGVQAMPGAAPAAPMRIKHAG